MHKPLHADHIYFAGAQAAAEHGSRGRTPNDDRVMFCAMARRERAGAADAAVLLTRDANLRVKSASNNVVALSPASLPRSRAALLRMCRNGGMPTAAPAPEPEPTSTDHGAGGGAPRVSEQAHGRDGAPHQALGPPAAAADAPAISAAIAVPMQSVSEQAWLQPRMPAQSQGAPAGTAQGRHIGDAAYGAGGLDRMSHLMLSSRASQDSTGSPTAGPARGDGAVRGHEHALLRGMAGGGEGSSMERLLRSLGSRDSGGLGRAGSGHSDGGGDPYGALAQDALALLESGLSDTALFYFQKEHGSVWTGVRTRLSTVQLQLCSNVSMPHRLRAIQGNAHQHASVRYESALSQPRLPGAQVTNEPVPWSTASLLEVLTKGWKSVYEDVVVDTDRRPAQAAIKRLKDSHRNLARSTGPAAAHSIADALKDIALLLGAFPTPSGSRTTAFLHIVLAAVRIRSWQYILSVAWRALR